MPESVAQVPAPGAVTPWRNRWLAGSIALSILFLAIVAFLPAPPAWIRAVVESKAGARHEAISTTHGTEELRKIEKALRAAGVEVGRAHRSIYGILATDVALSSPAEYWKPPLARETAAKIEQYARTQAIRAGLIQAFGSDAQDDAGFVAAFRPYERELPMLSEAQQLRLESLRLEGLRAPGPARAPRAAEAALAAELPPDTRFEYELRTSGIAHALSAAGFDFTESEFREIFRALAAARPEAVMLPSSAAFAEALQDARIQQTIKSTLGEDRYLQFSRLRDPLFSLLRRLAAARGMPVDKMARAYEILASAKNTHGEAQFPASKLAELLGTEAAADVLHAEQFYRRSLRATGLLPGADAAGLKGKPFHLVVPGRGVSQ